MRIGFYHYGVPSLYRGRDEARFLLQSIRDLRDNEFLVLDLEDPHVADNADLLGYALDFLQTVESEAKRKPLLYSAHYYMQPHNLEGHAELARYKLWYAAYQANKPPVPNPWDEITIWQFDEHGYCPGIATEVDRNILYGEI